MKMIRTKLCLLALAGFAVTAQASIDFITIPTGTAPNEVPGSPGPYSMGQEFTVNGAGIVVTALGAYDDGDPNSFATAALPVNVGIYAVTGPNAGQLVTTIATFTGAGSGTADGTVLFQSIAPTALGPGQYVIAASGYSGLGQGFEVFGNTAHPPYQGGGAWTFNDGGGVLSLGSSVGFPSLNLVYPVVNIDNSGAQPQYAAGDFQFTAAVPEPSTFMEGALLLLPFASGTLRQLRKSRSAGQAV